MKAEALADSLEAQFQPATVSLVPAVIEMVDVTLESYRLLPVNQSESTLMRFKKPSGALR
jgi:hypothetical protein